MSRRSSSVFAGFRFPREVISVAVRWYLRYGLSYRDVEELLAERGVTVDHVTVYRWVQRFTPEFIEAARLCRHVPGDRWFVDETYVKVSGRWTYLYRAIDQHGQVIDVLLSQRRDLAAARRFSTRALRAGTVPAEVTTDRAAAYPRVLDELIPSALHTTERYANNRVEADHGRLKARLRPMRGLKRHRSARILAAGHALVQRTSAAATTNSLSTSPTATGSASPSTSSQQPSERPAHPLSRSVAPTDRLMQHCQSYMFTTSNVGSVTQVVGTDPAGGTGSSVAKFTYNPYGSTGSSGTSAASALLRYTGGLYDTGANYTHLGQRWENPALGAFTQQDTQNQLAAPVNGNRYAYASGDPENNTDPTGQASIGSLLLTFTTGLLGGLACAFAAGGLTANVAVGAIAGAVCGAAISTAVTALTS